MDERKLFVASEENMEKKFITKKDTVGFVILLIVITLSWFLVWHFDLRESVRSLAAGDTTLEGVSTIIFFILAYIALIISLVPSAPLNIVAGVLFGPILGTFYTWLAVMVGGSISFLLARKFGENFVERLLKNKSPLLDKYNDKIANDGYEIILLFRIIPFFPIAGFNYAFGLTRMKFKTYFWGSAIGTIPGIFILTYFGETISDFSWHKVGVSVGLLGIMALASWNYKKSRKGNE